jgi:hypothetical protein
MRNGGSEVEARLAQIECFCVLRGPIGELKVDAKNERLLLV